MSLDLSTLLGNGAEIVRQGRCRRLLLVVFCLDAPFAFVFLVALQSYFAPQQIEGRAVAGLALSLFALGKLVLQYQAGRASDLVGPRRGLSIGLACVLAAMGVLLAAPTAPLLLVPASLLYGAGSSIAWPALLSEAHAMPVRLRASLTAAMTATTGAAGATALLLGLALPENLPFRVAIWLALVPVAVGLGLSLLPYAPGGTERRDTEDEHNFGLRLILADRSRAGLGAAFFLQSLAIAALVASFRALGRDLFGVSLHHETVLLLPVGASFAAGVLAAGVLGALPRRLLLCGALALGGSSLLVVGSTNGVAIQVALLGASCFGLGLAVPTTTALQLDHARSTPGALFGSLLALEGLGHILGPGLAAALSDVRLVMAAVGGVLIAAALASLQVTDVEEPVMRFASDVG